MLRQAGSDSRSAAIEDYVKAIYLLERAIAGRVTTNALAKRLSVTPASASGMVKRLAERELALHRPYRGVSLTPSGTRLALRVIRHHRLLETFLVRELGMPWERVHAEADILEHVVSDELEALLAAKLGHPTKDPHGDPIPTADLELVEPDTVRLVTLAPGDRGTFVRISDEDPAMLRYLGARGIAPGDDVEVTERQPFGGPLSVRINSEVHAFGGVLAEAMCVRRTDATDHALATTKQNGDRR